jgi:AcrR family transcriptional regulator
MSYVPATPGPAPMRRRDWQKEQTRLDLALAAFELAKAEGLAKVRVPQIAEVVGVSTRTFNNYFSSKEAAIVWPTTLRMAARMLAGALEVLAAHAQGPLLAGQPETDIETALRAAAPRLFAAAGDPLAALVG